MREKGKKGKEKGNGKGNGEDQRRGRARARNVGCVLTSALHSHGPKGKKNDSR